MTQKAANSIRSNDGTLLQLKILIEGEMSNLRANQLTKRHKSIGATILLQSAIRQLVQTTNEHLSGKSLTIRRR
jgi:hypothetical protein